MEEIPEIVKPKNLQRRWFSNWDTPPKTNMEPQKWWFVDVSPFASGYFQVPAVSFRGCIALGFLWSASDVCEDGGLLVLTSEVSKLSLGGVQKSHPHGSGIQSLTRKHHPPVRAASMWKLLGYTTA